MNKAKLKSYAPQARLDFIAAVTARANLLGLSEKAGKLEIAPSQTQGDVTIIAGQAWPAKIASQRDQLISRMQREGFSQTCEAIGYTWFNRFVAIRFMELHDYLDHGRRALSSSEGGLPDILTYAVDLAQAGGSGLPGLKAELLSEMKLAGNRDGELYRMLLVAQCNALSNIMPFLFERIDDDSELLLPDNLLRSDSVITKLVEEIPEEDWAEVEIIGWLYQFYISDKKDLVIGKVVKSEDIPAATQLFTPNWIVQYLVQNSVGRLWLMANPQSTLAKEWPYYINPAEQTPEVQAQLDALIQTRVREDGDTLNPESITVLDPACGSGHILVVAYDTLKAIYLERGYQPRVIPRLILEKNLYGLDIDDRAAQMAGFALMMKARADDRRLFNESIKLNVLSLQESNGLDASNLDQSLQKILDGQDLKHDVNVAGNDFTADDLFPESHKQSSLGESIDINSKNKELKTTIAELIATFANAKTFGSLIIVPKHLSAKLLWLRRQLELALQSEDLYARSAAQDLLPLVAQAQILTMQFDAVVANPPYMGNKFLVQALKTYLKENYGGFEKDLFSAFINSGLRLAKPSGQLGFMSPFVWMFISSYEELRQYIYKSATLSSLIQLEYSGFDGATVPICTFTFIKANVKNHRSCFIKLSDFRGADQQAPKVLEAISNRGCGWFYCAKPDEFKKIPGSPVAYWATKNVIDSFSNYPPLETIAPARAGLQTGENKKFVRLWHEVSHMKSGLNHLSKVGARESGKKWFPYNSGGSYRRWYGNNEKVIDWENDGINIKTDKLEKLASGLCLPSNSKPKNEQYYFLRSITWTAISSAFFGVRCCEQGAVFDIAGSSIFPDDESYELVSGYLCSKLSTYYLGFINQTLNIQTGDVARFPWSENAIRKIKNEVIECVKDCINLEKEDWDSFETSWEFYGLSFVKHSKADINLELSWARWNSEALGRLRKMYDLELKNNQLFISAYGFENELSPELPESQITISLANREKDCQRLISYAIGCMMGRYSLDEPGLIYACAGNVDFDLNRYSTFPADADGIVPITDELWFDDDVSVRIREFLHAVWGAGTLEENIAWLAEGLGSKAGETSDETIRRYVADKFFKDHLQTYKKRPIYWLFSSGKYGAFQALVYLHRYNEGTLARMRAKYVVPLTGKIQSRIEMLEKDVNAASSTAARNKLTKEVEKLKKKHVELLAYDEQLRHYADMRITLDLDDGVKVNYGKFGDLLAEVKAVTGGASDE
jgi:type II restriction/modification system DNA methylase subunit YeeA